VITRRTGGGRLTRRELARAAYAAALRSARVRSTAATWRRLVRAGENLRAALRDPRVATRDVLLVHDDAGERESLRGVLEGEGLRVITAAHGPEALSVLRRRRLLPRVIVVDLEAPLVSARELRRHLQRDPRLSSIPVIVTSDADEVDPLPAARRLARPVDPGELVAAVSRLGF
jgi:CheY-like chemotaxis protein